MGEIRSAGHRAVLLGGILVTAIVLLGYGATAIAQEEQKPLAKDQFKEEVTVTGTLIPRPTLEAMAPVTSLDVEAIQYEGINRLEDFLTNLPQIFVAQNSSVSNGASGAASVDLRFLGSQRTLVLIDGRRMPGAGASSNGVDVAPDLNFIPSALIKRVDILTGGASAVYGADAMSGVVNLILDKDFVGLKAGVTGSGYQHNNSNKEAQAINAARHFSYPTGSVFDGGQAEAYAAYGANFADGKGHATLYLDYRKTSGLYKGQRDYYACDVAGIPPTRACGGSSNAYPGRFLVYDAEGNPAGNGGGYTIDPTTGNTMINWSSARDAYNFNPLNSIQRPDERWGGGGFIDYEWNKHFHGYAEVMMMDDTTNAEIAPSADFLGSAGTTQVNCDNPMLSAQEVNILCTQAGYGPNDIATVLIGRRNVEGGPRNDNLDRVEYRYIFGLKGELAKGWNYDVYGLQNVTRVASDYRNDLHAARYQQAILVNGDPNDPSTWHCSDPTAVAAGCLPMNIFQIGGVTRAALDWLTIPELFQAQMKTQLISGKVTADLREYGWAFPSASEGIQLALGAEYRKEFLNTLPDFVYQQNLGMGTGGARLPVNGFYDVNDLFVEVQVPLVQGARGAKDLSLNLGYRYSDYNVNGVHPTYKIQMDYAPSADFKFRAGYNRATRAPNVGELFQPQAQDLQGTVDPCAGSAPAYSQAECANTGVTAAQYGHIPENPASQYNNLYGGNPHLNPEKADTYSAGIVITPSGLSGFTATFDYYDIKIEDAIGALFMNDIINSCATTANAGLCALIHRDQYGSLWLTGNGYAITTNVNIGKFERRGIDANVTYSLPIGKSLLDFNLIGSYFSKVFVDTGIYQYDCVGLYGESCGTPAPKWRHILRTSWSTGPATLSLAWRMIGSAKQEFGSDQPALANPDLVPSYAALGADVISAQNYFDLVVNYKLGKNTSLTLGVNNIADKEPPMGWGWGPNGNAAGFFGTYDAAGRYIHGSVLFNL
ncbi:MAG: TonB-dependent receptor [Acidobacteriia bacterium]|nr:TonB-dependent receptor [Terriglobia bacterium]